MNHSRPRSHPWLKTVWEQMRQSAIACYVTGCRITASSHATPVCARPDEPRRLSLYLRFNYLLDIRQLRREKDPIARLTAPRTTASSLPLAHCPESGSPPDSGATQLIFYCSYAIIWLLCRSDES